MAGTRFAVAGLLLLGWALMKGHRLPDARSIGITVSAGLLMLFLGNGAVTWVEQYLPSGFAAIIVATVPLWFVLLDRRQWYFYFSNKGIITGLIVGFAGVILLFSGKTSGDIFNDPMKWISVLVLIAGTVGWATGSLITKYKTVNGSTLMKVAIQMLAAGIAFYITGFSSGEQHAFQISQVTTSSLLALAYLIIFGSLIGYLAYIWLLGVRPPSLVGTYAYVNPVVAVLLGFLFAGETITGFQAIGLFVIILGLFMVNMYKEKKPTTERKEKKEAEMKAAENSL
jgi:drug/metabolite transporter (DMT)-like permease